MNTHLFFRRIALLVAVCAGVIVLGDVSKQTGIISAAPKAPAGSATYTAVADATIKQSAPDLNYGSAPTLDVLHGLEGSENGAALIRFDISALPSDATIDSAYLQLYLESGTGLNPVDLSLRIVTSSWNESTVTWNTAPAATPGWITWSMDATPGYKTTIDLSGWVAYWMTLPNYGVQLSGPTSNLFTRTFSSREGYNAAPSLVVNYHRPPTVMSGHIYVGDVGDTSTPLPGIEVALYCSSGANVQGDLVDRTDTDAQGAYTVGTTSICEYYNVMSFAPPGYYSLDATSSAGIRRSPTWIQYLSNQTAHTYTGDAFWDKVTPPVDNTPPGFWANFAPTQWVNTQTVPASEQVADTLSGLRVASAQFRYSVTGGETWSNWHGASITGADGTTSPQTISANVPFGHDSGPTSKNWVQFQVADMQGNPGTGPTHAINVDSIPPQNPTGLSSSTHTPGVWSNNPQVTAQWSGATDDRSGLKGYSVAWDHSSTTVPGVFVATSGTSFTNNASADSPDWWFHVRSIDQAGNAAVGAKHLGPFKIDTTPPMVFLTAPTAGAVATATFNVSWSGTDASGIASYDVQTNTDGGAWSAWLTGVTYQSATFTGQRGHTHYFRVRAHDLAGNVSGWSSSGWAKPGVNVTVRVQNENATPLQFAEVDLNGAFGGTTDSAGFATLGNVLVGDQLAARYLIEQHPSNKGAHDYWGGGNAAYRTYITSVGFDNAGNPQMFAVSNPSATQVLVVRRDQPLVGIYIVASVEWDASSAYLNEVLNGLQQASAYLYDLTDGQMLFNRIEVYDNKSHWNDADIQIYASNNVWPNAHGSVGGIWHGTDQHIYVGRYWDGNHMDQGPWNQQNGFRTFIHEFGHYGLDLYDEYLNASGGKTGAGCTTDRTATPPGEQASFMAYQFTATEMCSTLTVHPHNTNTLQQAKNGEPVWETVYKRYKDTQNPPRWTIERPSDRGSIMPGPTSIPVAYWVSAAIRNDANTGVCAPFTMGWQYQNGAPAAGFDVWTEGLIRLDQGKTSDTGDITIFGAHAGDTIRVHKDSSSGSTALTSCPMAGLAAPSSRVKLTQDPFTLDVRVVPSSSGTTVVLTAQASTALASAPLVQIQQAGAPDLTTVALTFNGTAYTGSAGLNAALPLQGMVRAQATDRGGYTVITFTPFKLQRALASDLTWVQSADAKMEVFLQRGSLTGDAIVGVSAASQAKPQTGLVLVGKPYAVNVSTGATALNIPANVNLYYASEDVGSLDLKALRIYHWDESSGRWVADGGTVDLENHLVSTQVSRLGTYILAARQAGSLYLPFVRR